MLRITREEARSIAIAAQGLDDPAGQVATKERVLETIRKIGCLQLDTISVIARSHYVVLWSRLGQYQQQWLDELHHPDHQIFEYWVHAASLIPIELYPYVRRGMAKREQDLRRMGDGWAHENEQLLHDVLEAVRLHGPISSSHFERVKRDEPVEPWAWWGGKPANRALDLLWTAGEIAIHRRVNFQRYYELSERLFPELHDAELPDETDERNALATRAVQAMGVAQPGWLNDYFRTKWGVRNHGQTKPLEILQDLEQQGIVFPVEVEDLGLAYVAESARQLVDDVRAGRRAKRTVLLSPFDNLIWDRARTEQLFDFTYRIECYTPAAKRIYGYFTLPILDRGRLIGRLDPKVDRRSKVLFIRALHLEDGVCLDEPMADRLLDTMRDFARFNEATTLVVEAGPSQLVGEFAA